MRTPSERWLHRLVVSLSLLPWALLFVLPIAALLGSGRMSGEPLGLEDFTAGFVDPLLLSKVRFTAGQALLSAVISGAVGLPLGILLRHSPRATDWLKVPFGVPTLVASAAWVSILSAGSLLYSFEAVILAHVVLNIPWVASLVAEAARSVPSGWDDLARTLGAGKVLRWRVVHFPVIAPAWFSALSQVFLLCSTSFTLVTILGGGPPIETLETAIFASVRTGTLDLVTGAQLALWQVTLSLLPWIVMRVLWQPVPLPPVPLQARKREPLWHFALAAIWMLPYLAFLREVDPRVLVSAKFWSAIASPLALSLGLALSVGTLAVLWSALAIAALTGIRKESRRRVLEMVFLLPSGVSTLTLSLGFWLAYSAWIDPFEGSLTALVLVQGLVFFPMIFRWLWPISRLRSQSGLDLARSLGASPVRAWFTVEWPRLRQPVLHALALVSAASIGELAAVSFFSSERMVTLPLLLSRWLSQYRFDQTHAAAFLLLVLSGVFALGSRWRRG